MSIKTERNTATTLIMSQSSNTSGSFEDYSGLYPAAPYLFSSTLNYAATGNERNDLYIGGTIDDCEITLIEQTSSEYPLNQTQATASGHIIEMDDTPGNQRILIKHKTGSGIELRNDGSVLVTTGASGQKVEVVHGTHTFIVESEGNLVYKGNLNLKVTGDYNVDIKGDYNLNIAGNRTTKINGSDRQTIYNNYSNTIVGGSSTTVLGPSVNTHLQGITNNVKGDYINNIDGASGFYASGDLGITSQTKIFQSSPDVNIAANSLSVFGDTGTIGGDNIVMYANNAHIDRVNSTSMHATTFHGSLNGKAQYASKADQAASAPDGPGVGGGTYTEEAADLKTTAEPTETILNDYLSKAAGGVRRVKVDNGDYIKNFIDKSVETGGISVIPVDTNKARSRLRDEANKANSAFIKHLLSTGSITEKYDSPTPDGIGRIISGAPRAASTGATKLGNTRASTTFIPLRTKTVQILPEFEYNPLYLADPITSKTKLAANITIAKFLASTDDPTNMNHIKDNSTRVQIAKYYYLHAKIMKTVIDDTDEFKDYNLVVAEGLYRAGPQEVITPDSINDLKSKGRAVVYKLVDQQGKENLTKLFDLAMYWKDTITFDKMIIAYDTMKDDLTGRIIITLPEVDDSWSGSYNKSVETLYNNKVLSQDEIVECLPFPSTGSGAGASFDTGKVGNGYNGSIKGKVDKLDKRLITMLEKAAEQTQLNVLVTSGYRDPGKNPSGRHAGYAADIALFDGDINYKGPNHLSVTQNDQLSLIKSFIKAFIDNCKLAGLTPSVGAANNSGTYPKNYYYAPLRGQRYRLYMGGNHFHLDIARTPGINASRGGSYWGGSGNVANGDAGKDVPAPIWLTELF